MSSPQLRDDLERKIQSLSPEKRALLARRLKSKRGDAPAGIRKLERAAGVGTFPLSFAQQRLWFLEQWEPGNPAYVQLFNLHLKGKVQPELLSKALNEIARRHESLRTIFLTVDGQPVQKIHRELSIPLPQIDLRELSSKSRIAEAARITLEDSRKPFDLVTGPLIRAQLLRLSDEEYRFLVTQHHIITDAWSLNLMLREIAALYSAYALGQPSPLTDLQLQYVDFAHWQREWLQGPALDKQMAFWRQKLSHLQALDLPADHPRPSVQTYRGAKRFQTLPLPVASSLRALCQREGVTLYILALAVFKVLLLRYTGQESLAVGSPNANRGRVETEPLMGFLTNTLVLHTDVSGDPTFRELLKRVKETALGAYTHQDVPFEKLVEELRPERDLSRSPLFQVLFQTITVPTTAIPLPDASLAYHEFDNKTAKFDLTMQVAEMVDGLICSCEFSTDLFKPETIDRLLGHYRTLLESVIATPEQRVSSLPMLTQMERQQLFETWNPPPVPPNDERTLPDLVSAWAEKTPNATAVQFNDEQLTYRELNELANRWAHALQRRGVGPEIPVAVFIDRSLDMIVALLAVMKAGGAYVPIDPIYPRERIAHVLDDIQTPVLLTHSKLIGSLPSHKAEALCMDTDWQQVVVESPENPVSGVSPENLAYVIFTSGSTGRPKGVQITHKSVVHLFESTRDLFNFSQKDTWTVFHSFAFDFSVWEIWSPLTNGGRLIVVPTSVVQSPDDFYELLCREQVTVMNLTPSAFRAVNESRLKAPRAAPTLRMLVVGGEALPGDLVEALAGWKVDVWNFYGPTESTVWATCHKVDLSVKCDGAVSIGRPLPDNHLYVLDSNLQARPVGVPGELHIGGAGLARGYFNRPELTAKSFIPDPFAKGSDERLYKTGDLARFAADGTIQFLGRIDHQVKLRGFRIELGEIESVLAGIAGVASNIVVAREDTPGQPRLVAYVVRTAPETPTPADLRTRLLATLPEYMVPAAFVFMEKLPLNANGKIDRRALPVPNVSGAKSHREYIAPREELERQLVSLFEKVLNVRPVSIDDNFFELGGHSLIAIRLFAQVERIYGKKLPLSALFLAPTVEQLAAIIRQEKWESPYKALVPIQPRGMKPIFFCVHGAGGEVLFYRDLAKRLGEDQPFYGIKARHFKELSGEDENLVEVARSYLAEVRMMQPEGPYYLGGTSLGGVFAFEMAQQLLAEGQQVAFLAFFDSFHPEYLRYRPHVTALHRKVYDVYHVLDNHLGALWLLEPGKRGKYVRSKIRRAFDEFRAGMDGIKRGIGQRFLKATKRQVPDRYRVYPHRLRTAVLQYRAQPYAGKITIFRAMRQPLGIYPDRTLGWRGLAAEIEIIDVPGFHANIVSEPRVRFLVEKMQAALKRVYDNNDNANSSREQNNVEAKEDVSPRINAATLGTLNGANTHTMPQSHPLPAAPQ